MDTRPHSSSRRCPHTPSHNVTSQHGSNGIASQREGQAALQGVRIWGNVRLCGGLFQNTIQNIDALPVARPQKNRNAFVMMVVQPAKARQLFELESRHYQSHTGVGCH